MVRSLWTAASGMIAQQTNVDTISNNLANVNTNGYKTESAEFKSLLYQNLQTRTTSGNGVSKPIGAQVGLGSRNSAITSNFRQGNLIASENLAAFAVDGNAFFSVRGQDGKNYYTRNGNFNMSIGNNGLTLTDSEGAPVLSSEGEPIVFPENTIATRILVTSEGEFAYPDEDGVYQSMDIKLGLFQFTNPAGLSKKGGSLFEATAASGAVMNEATNEELQKSKVKKGFLEGSNVQVVDEMVNMIVAQRAYELNSKAIQASDEMMQQANGLRR